LIAKKFILEKRVLSKVLDNLGYDYEILDDIEALSSKIASGKYDIVFTDEDLIDESISRNNDKLAIITSVNSKEEIESLIKKHRG
jgi:serine protease inhibitor ecotin